MCSTETDISDGEIMRHGRVACSRSPFASTKLQLNSQPAKKYPPTVSRQCLEYIFLEYIFGVYYVRMYNEAWSLDTDFSVVICIAENSDEMRLEISAKDCL